MRPIALLALCLLLAACGSSASSSGSPAASGGITTAAFGVPRVALDTLEVIDRTGNAPTGYVGGRRFGNFEGHLPVTAGASRVHYREWDVARHVLGVNRGPRRLVTGDDGSAYYSADHYATFLRIR